MNFFFRCGKGKTNEIADLPSYDMKVVMQIEPRQRPDPGGSDFSKIRQSKGMHSPVRVGVGRSGRCVRDTIKKEKRGMTSSPPTTSLLAPSLPAISSVADGFFVSAPAISIFLVGFGFSLR